jgi:hypothetical protein
MDPQREQLRSAGLRKREPERERRADADQHRVFDAAARDRKGDAAGGHHQPGREERGLEQRNPLEGGHDQHREQDRERDYDQRYNRPNLRLMNEVYRVGSLFQRLEPVLAPWPIEVHLDINPNEMHGSSCVVQQAIGYIRGTCNIIPMIKPDAFAASYAADRLKSVRAA